MTARQILASADKKGLKAKDNSTRQFMLSNDSDSAEIALKSTGPERAEYIANYLAIHTAKHAVVCHTAALTLSKRQASVTSSSGISSSARKRWGQLALHDGSPAESLTLSHTKSLASRPKI